MKATKKSPYTNWIGAIMVFAALGLYIAQFFVVLEKELDNAVLYAIGGAGLLIWLGLSDEVVKKYLGKK